YDDVTIVNSSGLTGLRYTAISGSGDVLFTKNARKLHPFQNGYASFESVTTDSRVEEIFGLVDKSGKEIFPLEFDAPINSIDIDGRIYHIVIKNGKAGVLDTNKEVVIPFEYLSISHLDEDLFLVGFEDVENPTSQSVWGTTIQNKDFEIRDLTNERKFNLLFDAVYFNSGFEEYDRLLVQFKNNTKWSLVDFNGNELFTHENSQVKPVSENLVSIGRAQVDGNYYDFAISDLEGNLKNPYTIAHRTEISMGMIGICVQENTRRGCGYMDENGQLKIPLTYTSVVEPFQEDGRAIVANSITQSNSFVVQMKGVIDLQGKQIIPPIFGKIEWVSEKYYKVALPNNSHNFLVGVNSGEPIDNSAEYAFSDYGRYYITIRNYEKAVSYFQRIVDRYLKTEDRYWYALSLSNIGNYQGANNHYTQVISETDNRDLRGLSTLNRADNYFEMGRSDLGRQGYDLVLSEQDNDPRIRMRYASVLEKYQFMTDAISQYQEILKTNPNVAEVHQGLGKVQLIVDQVEASIASLNKAIQLNPSLAESYNFRGQAFMINKEPEKAIPDFLKAIELNTDPELTTVHIRLAAAYEASGNTPKACELWDQLAPLDENSRNKFETTCNQ
ncbi:MAG: tetratricopeptide repeat protein, partial [Cyanothece sp. SIO1E1]|nr:tetratricopeptide repeat protein [Cyanothece sp. SIO1E1]